jgi:two-component system, cell cycle sensor histidine kinase and response regulator CckA
MGIPAEHLPHIFEPFFTTKEVGQGTGLGLATVHGIVAQSGGQIYAHSEPGRGTRFTVLFPLTTSSGGAAAPVHPALPTQPPRATILLVEDEVAVRTILARTLRDEGYEVLEARHGREALTRVHERADIRLVLTDVVMPVMGGRALGEQLSRERPGLPLIWMSGYPRDTAFADGTGGLEHPFLQKPIDPDLLIRTVGQAVRGAEAR